MTSYLLASHSSPRISRAGLLIGALLIGLLSLPTLAQQGEEQTWTVNFKDTDIVELVRFVANATGKTVVIDPKVKGKVQVVSAEPVNAEELYDLFLSILEVHNFTAIDSGGVLRVVPMKDARSSPVPVVASQSSKDNSEVITQVIQLENISAAKLIPVLRPLAPQQAHMAAYAPSNAIIVSDTSANIHRIREIIENIDRSAVQKTDIIELEHASAEEVVRMIEQLQKSQTSKGQAESKKLLLVADKRTNSVLVNGDELERQRIKTLIRHLDTRLTQSGNVKVIYLQYAEAKSLAEVLSNIVKNMENLNTEGGQPAASRNKAVATIEADEGTNSLIVTANADMMQSLQGIIRSLDIRRAQVLVEAIIVEVGADNGRDLGVEWMFMNDSGAYGASNNGSGMNQSIGSAIFDSDSDDIRPGLASAITGPAGQVLGFGKLSDSLSFNVVVNALQSDAESNILSTPSILTLDNEEATIVVGENVPFITGSYSSTGNSSNPDSPFQTVKRENVGITLKVTPRINEGDSLVLDIFQEVSNLIPDSNVNGQPVTSERKIETKVLVDNGQTIVLGGLIDDQVTESVSKVPFLGDIPFIGALFRSTSTSVKKRNLMIFLRPSIMRDSRSLSGATAAKYRYIRDLQEGRRKAGVSYIDDGNLPMLSEWKEQMDELDRQLKAEDADSAKDKNTDEPATVDLREE